MRHLRAKEIAANRRLIVHLWIGLWCWTVVSAQDLTFLHLHEITGTRRLYIRYWEGSKAASLVCVGLLYLASFGTVLPPSIPRKLLWAFALWSGLRWTNIQSWTLFMCCFPVISMFCINFADGPKPCWPSYGVTQGVWMGLLWGTVEEYEVPVEVPVTR